MKKINFKILFIGLGLFLVYNCATKKNVSPTPITSNNPADLVSHEIPKFVPSEEEYDMPNQKKWVDSIYNQLSLDEKFGQLFMVATWSNKDAEHISDISKLITNYKIGGLIFFQGGPMRQANLTNKYQSKSKVPLFIGNDAEWGLNMRLDSTYRFPTNMTLGAVQNLKLIEKTGALMADQCKRMNIQFNFAPVLDINTNPKNPIIGFRSFGENKHKVTEHAIALMKGMHSKGVFATGKHFPGHGDTETDSHKGLPIVNFSKDRLFDVEFYPYKKMFKEGLESVMVAHLNVPSLESRPNYPSSISYNIITNVLKGELGFKGLVFTDALNMKAASNFKSPGEIDLEAFLAGNDVLLYSENVPLSIEKLKKAYAESIISEDRLSYSVKKILKYKYKSGLNNLKPIDKTQLVKDLNKPECDALQYELFENAVTLLKNESEILPIKDIAKQKIAFVKLGDDNATVFLNTLKKYTEITEVSDKNIDSLNIKLQSFDVVIVGFHKSNKVWAKQEFTETEVQWIQELAKNNKVILDVFTRPYSLLQIPNLDLLKGLIVSYQNADMAQEISAQLIFGALEAKGKLPVSILPHFKEGDGLSTKKIDRLGFSVPENVGMNSLKLAEIDKMAQKAIESKITPGMQILVARKGKVVYQKSFGNPTYESKVKVSNSDLYDIASVTKIVATLPSVMQLYDKNKVNLNTTLGDMLPILEQSNKANITFKELLSHYGKLQAWIPFYKKTLDSLSFPSEKYYSKESKEGFTKQVAQNLFIRNDYHDTIIKQIKDSPLLSEKKYKYSDFTFILLKEYVERMTAKSLDQLVEAQFYQTMGMNYTTFNPLNHFDKSVIIPTENDNYFRHQLVQGYVHDMAAAMEGGVSGHAGLFSNAMDVAKMMQLYLQKGHYGGITYFAEDTFDAFNTCYFCSEGNRRALGFDKQLGNEGPTCGCVSDMSFGHTGFTGIMAWADPKTETIYIFVSNRTYPDSNAPNKLSKENIRENIQKIIQESIYN